MAADPRRDGHGRPHVAASETRAKEKHQTRINDTFGKSGGWREANIDKTLPLTLSQRDETQGDHQAKVEGGAVAQLAEADHSEANDDQK